MKVRAIRRCGVLLNGMLHQSAVGRNLGGAHLPVLNRGSIESRHLDRPANTAVSVANVPKEFHRQLESDKPPSLTTHCCTGHELRANDRGRATAAERLGAAR
jgi:hypothetical protein